MALVLIKSNKFGGGYKSKHIAVTFMKLKRKILNTYTVDLKLPEMVLQYLKIKEGDRLSVYMDDEDKYLMCLKKAETRENSHKAYFYAGYTASIKFTWRFYVPEPHQMKMRRVKFEMKDDSVFVDVSKAI